VSTIEQAIAATVPGAWGHRHGQLFNFVRMLKAIPGLADADVGSLREYVRQWHCAARPFISTKPFDETWADFIEGWRKVKFPAGTGPIQLIYQQALTRPSPLIIQRYDTPQVQQLIVLCRALQQATGEKPFFLACRTAGQLLHISHSLAAKWLRMLAVDQVIELVTPWTIHRANEYRYRGD
jgi:hypothetical protein